MRTYHDIKIFAIVFSILMLAVIVVSIIIAYIVSEVIVSSIVRGEHSIGGSLFFSGSRTSLQEGLTLSVDATL